MQNRCKNHHKDFIKVGDVVAVKTSMRKPYNYSIGITSHLDYNDLQEVNAVTEKN